MAVHPANAVFVSGDGRVSFDERGRKLDSGGNVVWGDYQGLRGANARVRPEIIQAFEEEERERQRLAQQQAQAATATYRPPSVEVSQAPQGAPPPSWGGVGEWNRFGPGGQPQAPRYDPLSSAPPVPRGEYSFAPLPPALLDVMGQGGRPQPPQPPAWEPPASEAGMGNWNQYTPPMRSEPMSPPMVPGWNRFRR